MDIRKIGLAASCAAGAALAFAPLASADVDSTALLGSEISAQNSLLEFAALFTGNTADITQHGAGVYDTIASEVVPRITDPADASQVTALEYFLYGVNPIEAGISNASGPYNEFNGALTEFYDAYNVYAYAAGNGGVLDTNVADYLGSQTTIAAAVGGDDATLASAAEHFFNIGIGDLQGYFGIFPEATPESAAASGFDISSTLTSEVNGLNSLFASDVAAAGIDSSKIIDGTGVQPWDTILPGDTNDMFNTLVFGFNPDNISTDPGAYDVFNGALTEFANAYNVGLFALLNGGDLIDSADIFGTHADFLAGGVSSAITDFMQLGFSDVLGYFDFSALMPTM